MSLVQLNFFETKEESEISAIWCEVNQIKESGNKVRKGMYARLNEVEKECKDIKSRLEIMESHICKNKCLIEVIP